MGLERLLKQAKDHLTKGEIAKALELYSTIVNENPQDGMLHVHRAAAYRKAGYMKAAMEDLEEAIFLDPMCDTAHLELARLYCQQGLYDQALEAGKTVVRIYESAEGYTAVAHIYNRLGQADQSLAYAQRALFFDKKHVPTLTEQIRAVSLLLKFPIRDLRWSYDTIREGPLSREIFKKEVPGGN